MNEVLFDVLVGVVIVISIIITRYLVPYLKSQIQETKYAELLDMVAQAVRKAEQKIRGTKQGAARKAQVVAFLSNYLTENGIHITEEQLDTLIEAAVWSMNNKE